MSEPDISVFAEAPWRALTEADLGPAMTVPTMLSQQERRMYVWLVEHWARGAGAIVDLGCFAGGSTALFAQGQRRAGRGGPIHAYDGFKISDPLKEKFLYPAGIARFSGDNLLPVAKCFLEPWAEYVRLHAGRIEQIGWAGGPIEILALDASKTAATMDRMAADFFGSLLPGRSLIVQQDFLHWKQPWIAVQMELLAEYFEPLAFCPRDNVVFRCTAPIGPEALGASQTAGLDDAAMLEALERIRRRLQGLGIGQRLKTLARAVQLNPGARTAWAMKTRPD